MHADRPMGRQRWNYHKWCSVYVRVMTTQELEFSINYHSSCRDGTKKETSNVSSINCSSCCYRTRRMFCGFRHFLNTYYCLFGPEYHDSFSKVVSDRISKRLWRFSATRRRLYFQSWILANFTLLGRLSFVNRTLFFLLDTQICSKSFRGMHHFYRKRDTSITKHYKALSIQIHF